MFRELLDKVREKALCGENCDEEIALAIDELEAIIHSSVQYIAAIEGWIPTGKITGRPIKRPADGRTITFPFDEYEKGTPAVLKYTRIFSRGASIGYDVAITQALCGSSGMAHGPIQSFDDIVKMPAHFYGKSAEEIAKTLGPGWTRGNYGITGTGWKFTKGDKSVFFHTGGRHVGPYWGYSSGVTGKVKIAGPGYKPLPGDKAKVLSCPCKALKEAIGAKQ